jgi:hypothetical protein
MLRGTVRQLLSNPCSWTARNIKTVIVVCGFVSDLEESSMQDREDYEVISRKGRCCHVTLKTTRWYQESEGALSCDPEDYEVISRKGRCCHVCSWSRDVKTQIVFKRCGHYVCKDNVSMTVTCDTCKNKNETDESDKSRCFSNSSSSSNHFIIFTFLLTPWSRVLLEKPIVSRGSISHG